MALIGALCVAELSAAMPKAGGEYIYLREAYGPLPAFLSGWMSFLLGFSAPIAVLAFVAAEYLLSPVLGRGNLGEIQEWTIKGFAFLLILLLTLPHLAGHRQSSWTLNVMTILKISLLLFNRLAAMPVSIGTPCRFRERVLASS